jgi:hypothetical protein
MSVLEEIDLTAWEGKISKEIQRKAIHSLEEGRVLYLPSLPFALQPDEEQFLTPENIDPKRKNISYDLKSDRVGGSLWKGEEEKRLRGMLKRYATSSQRFIKELFPHYASHLAISRTSLRPVEILGRKSSSVHKDDTRLHIDAFPSNPTTGFRLLRIFTNINREGKPRVWRVGEPFEEVVKRFTPSIPTPIPGAAFILKFLKITKKLRTPYDHYMLHMHNKMKSDGRYQKKVSQEEIHFPPGCSWIVFTDQVSHAALSGKDLLEQTFFLPVNGLNDINTAPLSILEKHLNKSLL